MDTELYMSISVIYEFYSGKSTFFFLLPQVTSPLGLDEPSVKFAIHRNLYAHVRRIRLDCCMSKKKTAWNITSEGLNCVGQDEVNKACKIFIPWSFTFIKIRKTCNIRTSFGPLENNISISKISDNPG